MKGEGSVIVGKCDHQCEFCVSVVVRKGMWSEGEGIGDC